ncbi:MAG: porin, partial [Phyllobacteriaceae bacterium]|nr:porin [Phyllobacteriaceae bacterium]
KWSIAASYTQKFSDTVTASLGVQYWDEVAFVPGTDQWSVGANVDWTPVQNFLVRAQVQYVDSGATDSVTGRLRFQRSF